MARKQKKYHFIYKTTCVVTNKFYVGMHSTDNLQDGYLGSGKILGYSLNKHGRENHKLEILEMCGSREQLKQREKEIVNEEMLAHLLNMNLKYGGEGGFEHQNFDSQIQRSKGLKGQAKMKWLRENDPTWSVRRSQKMVESNRLAVAEGRRKVLAPDWTGRKHSVATKIKIGKKNSIHQKGSGNSNFGKCWVRNENGSASIPIEKLDDYLASGFVRGRRIKF